MLREEFDNKNNLFNVIFSCFFEVMVERTRKFIEESNLLAVLQKAGWCRSLVCNGGNLQYKDCNIKHRLHQNSSTLKGLTSNDDTVIPCWAKLQGHLMFVFVDSQVVLISKSLCKVKKENRQDSETGSVWMRSAAPVLEFNLLIRCSN